MRKSDKVKNVLVVMCFFGMLLLYWRTVSEYSNDTYKEMCEIVDNESLIGLSIDEVKELLGEPQTIYSNDNEAKLYAYYAGSTFKKSILGKKYKIRPHELRITFDESDKVKHAYIHECT